MCERLKCGWLGGVKKENRRRAVAQPDAGWVGNSYWFVWLAVQRKPSFVLGTHLDRTSGGASSPTEWNLNNRD
jgi:hypothetical protein